jgi:hypothetical protein
MARHRSKSAGSAGTGSPGTCGPHPGRMSAAPSARGRRVLAGLAALWLGYLLFYAVFFAEMAYSIPRRLNHDCLGMHRRWYLASLGFTPFRSFALGPCQRFPHLGLALVVAAALLLGLGYLRALRTIARQPEAWPLPRLFLAAALAALPLVLLLPPTSVDYLAYLFGGRVAAVYHVNPWHHTLAEFPAEQIYLSRGVWGADLKFIYGPVWALVMAMIASIGHLLAPGDLTPATFLLNVLLLRAANVAAFAAAALAVWRINGRSWPGRQRLVTAAFLLNPLLVYEVVGACHNDVWGVAFLLWACCLFLRDDIRFVGPLALSILTKCMAIAVAPIVCLYYVRRRDWRPLSATVAAVVMSLGLTLLTDPEYMTSRLLAGSATHVVLSPTALPQVFLFLLRITSSGEYGYAFLQTVAKTLTLLFIPVYLALVWRARTREQIVEHSLWVLTLYLVGVYMQTMAWYLVWPLGLLFAVRWTRAAANAVWASWAVLFGYVVYFWNHNHGAVAPSLAVGFLMAIGVPALVCLVGHWGWWSAFTLPATADDRPIWEYMKRRPGRQARESRTAERDDEAIHRTAISSGRR